MAEYWYNNGQSASSLGMIGYTGANRYVVVYPFTVGSDGCSHITVTMTNMFSHQGSNTTLSCKIATFPSQYASGTASPDGEGAMSYTTSWGGDISFDYNLTAGTYYATIYVSGSSGYWSTVYADAGSVSTSGSYSPTTTLEFTSVSSSVETQNNVLLTVNNPSSIPVIAYFYYNGTQIAYSSTFTTQLSYTCPRSWFSNNISVTTMSITVTVKKTDGTTITSGTKSFTLNADSGMKPVVTSSSFTGTKVNTGTIDEFIATLTKVRITFARSGSSYVADMSNTAGAEIRSVWIEYNGSTITTAESGSPYSYLTDAITASGTGYVRVWMQDSRERTGYRDYTFTAYAYVPPSLSDVELYRCNDTSPYDESATGTCIKLKASFSITDINSQNIRKLSVYYKESTATEYTWERRTTYYTWDSTNWYIYLRDIITNEGILDSSKTYSIKLKAEDTAGGEQEYVFNLSFEKWMICWTSTGEGCGIGQAPGTDNVLQIPSTWEFLAGSARLGNDRMVLVEGKHYDSALPSTGTEGQVFFLLVNS